MSNIDHINEICANIFCLNIQKPESPKPYRRHDYNITTKNKQDKINNKNKKKKKIINISHTDNAIQ